jgi:hypothetical protein
VELNIAFEQSEDMAYKLMNMVLDKIDFTNIELERWI